MLTNELKQEIARTIARFLDEYSVDDPFFATDARGLLRRVLATPVDSDPSPIKVGDRIKSTRTGSYLGVVERTERVVYYRNTSAGIQGATNAEDVEIAPDLTPELAWSEVPLLIIREIYDRGVRLHLGLDADDQRAIRGHCYKLLGGAKIKITPEVKARVRQIIIDVARAVGAVVY